MANVDSPSGFRPYKHYSGGVVRASAYKIASAYNADIFTGDLVKTTGTTKRVAVCVAGDRTVGSFNGCRYVASDGSVVFSPRWIASTATSGSVEATAYVYDDPNILFHTQVAGTLAEADIGLQGDMIATHAGDTATGQSGQEMDTTQGAGLVGLKLIDYVRDGVNEVGLNAKVLVLVNEHENGPTAATTSV